MEGIPLILGSATPSLEAWYKAQRGEFRLIELPERVLDRPLPDVVTVDLRSTLQDRSQRGAIIRLAMSGNCRGGFPETANP